MERFGAETLLERAVRVATESQVGAVYVVVNADDAAVVAEARRLPCFVVLNAEAKQGMASSIREGVRLVRSTASGVVMMTCDQPAVTAEHLRLLVETGGGGEIVASAYGGRRGVPAYLASSAFGELLELQGDAGARDLLRGARAVDLPNGELDLDTEEELERARELFRTEPV